MILDCTIVIVCLYMVLCNCRASLEASEQWVYIEMGSRFIREII